MNTCKQCPPTFNSSSDVSKNGLTSLRKDSALQRKGEAVNLEKETRN
jgi:hypothetical protein